jgi:hypothetical protein
MVCLHLHALRHQPRKSHRLQQLKHIWEHQNIPTRHLVDISRDIPEFGAAQGISFYTVNNLLTEGASTYEVRTPTAFIRSITPGHPIEYLDNRQIRMRTNPSDLNQDGTPIHNMIFHYNSALARAIHI